MTDLVQRLREIDSEFGFTLCATAADRIEQLESSNSIKELSYQQLIDDLSAARRENAELRKEMAYWLEKYQNQLADLP